MTLETTKVPSNDESEAPVIVTESPGRSPVGLDTTAVTMPPLRVREMMAIGAAAVNVSLRWAYETRDPSTF